MTLGKMSKERTSEGDCWCFLKRPSFVRRLWEWHPCDLNLQGCHWVKVNRTLPGLGCPVWPWDATHWRLDRFSGKQTWRDWPPSLAMAEQWALPDIGMAGLHPWVIAAEASCHDLWMCELYMLSSPEDALLHSHWNGQPNPHRREQGLSTR